METPKFVVCAALRLNNRIICGARHFDNIMRGQIGALIESQKWHSAEQGFIDQFGNFLTREQAWILADQNGQIRRPTGFETFANPRPANIGDSGMLFSENLY